MGLCDQNNREEHRKCCGCARIVLWKWWEEILWKYCEACEELSAMAAALGKMKERVYLVEFANTRYLEIATWLVSCGLNGCGSGEMCYCVMECG